MNTNPEYIGLVVAVMVFGAYLLGYVIGQWRKGKRP